RQLPASVFGNGIAQMEGVIAAFGADRLFQRNGRDVPADGPSFVADDGFDGPGEIRHRVRENLGKAIRQVASPESGRLPIFAQGDAGGLSAGLVQRDITVVGAEARRNPPSIL